MTLETLVVTMNQTDFSIIEKMNIQGDAVIANQCAVNKIETIIKNNSKYTMISTTTKGVGLNRNIALAASSADIFLFADDDNIYFNNYDVEVKNAFKKNPQADIIIFGIIYTRDGAAYSERKLKNKRVKFWESMRFGACSLAIRKSALLKANLSFNQLFGGGCIYGSGEDSIFIADCLKKNLKIYTDEYVLGTNARDSSTWFTGFDDKFLYDKGALLKAAFPKTYLFFLPHFLVKFKKLSGMKLSKCYRLMKNGADGYNNLTTYTQK